MASTTVNSTLGTTIGTTGVDVSAVISSRAVGSSKKAVGSTQDFSSVLNSTTQNAKSNQESGTTANKVKSVSDTTSDKQAEGVSDTNQSVKDNTVDKNTADKLNDSDDKTAENEAVSDVTAQTKAESDTDDTAIEVIATALNVIIDQVKEIVGVDDDTITATMEDLGLDIGDLLDSNNLAELVAGLSGEESAISLVANEDLYSKLQTLIEIVDTQLDTVLNDTGLGKEELDTILDSTVFDNILDTAKEDIEISPQELNTVTETTIVTQSQEPQVTQTAGEEVSKEKAVSADTVSDTPKEEEPVVIVEDKTTKPATTYSKIPENQQDTSNLKNEAQSENTNARADKNQNNQSSQTKDYSQNQSFSQSPQETTVNENLSEITETATSYTTDNTESIMRQLADTVKLIKEDNLTQMELQLHPSSLGTVNVSLISKGGAVTAQFTAQNEQVRAAIESQATQLQQDLENQGVKVEAIEVTVESHQMEKNLDEDNRRREKEGEQAEESIKATRRANINLRTLGEDGSVLEEIQGADEATRIAMELMSANGNSMDLLA